MNRFFSSNLIWLFLLLISITLQYNSASIFDGLPFEKNIETFEDKGVDLEELESKRKLREAEKLLLEIVELFNNYMTDEAKFQRQSKLGINISSNLEFPKFFERTLSQFSICFGFFD